MCHGIVREYAKTHERIGVFTLERNYPSVAFMFRDLTNVDVIRGTDVDAKKFIAEKTLVFPHYTYDTALVLGFDRLDRNSGELLENQFYTMAGIDLSKKWDSFHVDRDSASERNLFDRVSPQKPYVFLHEDIRRSYLIDRRLIDKKYTIVTPDPTLAPNSFDYCSIIEQAAEIHVIDSSFMFLIDCLPYDSSQQKLVVHRYARENEDWKLPTLGKNWKIINIENWHIGFLRFLRRRITEYKGRIRSKLFPIQKSVEIA
jgi:hypothetical protein